MPSKKFSAPSSSTGIQWDELKGSLLLVAPQSVETGIKTSYGDDASAVKADVTVLDGDKEGTVYTSTLIFPKVLQSQVKNDLGGLVLGRLGQGQKKPGQSAPWMLTAATPADEALASKHLDASEEDVPY